MGSQLVWQLTSAHCLVTHCSVIAPHWWTLLPSTEHLLCDCKHCFEHFYTLFWTLLHTAVNCWALLCTGLLMDSGHRCKFWCTLSKIGAQSHCIGVFQNIGAHCLPHKCSAIAIALWTLVPIVTNECMINRSATLSGARHFSVTSRWLLHQKTECLTTCPRRTLHHTPVLFLWETPMSYISSNIDQRFESYHPIVLVVGNR